MGPSLIRIVKVISVVGLILFGFWVLNQIGIIDTKALLIQSMSFVPGMSDLGQNYELGKKRGDLLAQREAELLEREKKLKAAQEKLTLDREQLDNEKFAWEKAHPTSTPGAGQYNVSNVPAINQPVPTDAKIKEYLAMVGKMKPSEAAIVIQKLPEQTVFMIFDQLRPSQVTRIMEKLPEDYLAKLTQDRLNKYRNM